MHIQGMLMENQAEMDPAGFPWSPETWAKALKWPIMVAVSAGFGATFDWLVLIHRAQGPHLPDDSR